MVLNPSSKDNPSQKDDNKEINLPSKIFTFKKQFLSLK